MGKVAGSSRNNCAASSSWPLLLSTPDAGVPVSTTYGLSQSGSGVGYGNAGTNGYGSAGTSVRQLRKYLFVNRTIQTD